MPALGVFTNKDGKTVKPQLPQERGVWNLGEDDLLLYALITDPVYCAELLGEDPSNREYAGMFKVRDYQYPLFRTEDNYAGFTCARSVGKTESIKWRSIVHAFKRVGENLLLTAPELIHLLPLTDAIEGMIRAIRLTREFLDTRGQKTGFTHRPFGVDFIDGTKIVGRIPRLKGPQPLDAKILTPSGWTTMGAIAPGDEVIGATGAPTRVVGVTNTWDAPVFRVEFTDGSSTRADAHHRWRVSTDTTGWEIVNTSDIARALDDHPKRRGGTLNMYRVPPAPVVEYVAVPEPPLDPYIVGALLGDGAVSGHSAVLVCADVEIVERVRARLPDECSITALADKPIHHLITGRGRGYLNPVLSGLRELGILGCTAHTKFIPEQLKRGSVTVRLEVLRGLLDTDGSAKNGAAHLVSASRQLTEDAAEIARSLGGWASCGRESRHSGGVYWRTTIRLRGRVPFALTRKAERCRPDARLRHRSIRAVVPMGRETVRCIKVAADDESYLTDDMIATLNTGVKGQHQPDLIVDEAQDYPDAGWTEVHETVLKDHLDADGKPDFTYHFYGVHSGTRDSGFHERASKGAFKIIQITGLQRPGWSAEEKEAAKAAYGGTSASDYRRNILGEPGGAASGAFITARLVACMDQDRESDYNQFGYRYQNIRVEDFEEVRLPINEVLDLPAGLTNVWCGMDIGLTHSPTVITIWTLCKVKGTARLKLVRRIHLERMRTRTIREACYAIGWFYGKDLKGFGMDITGLGFPMWQEMEDDEACPPIMRPAHDGGVARGYFFNAKVPVGVDKQHVTTDKQGRMRDMIGSQVTEENDPLTGGKRYVIHMPMIEASTRYLREMVDTTLMMLPFDREIIADMQMETQQRVARVAGLKNKPNALHILDSMRAMAMAYHAEDVEAELSYGEQQEVLDVAL